MNKTSQRSLRSYCLVAIAIALVIGVFVPAATWLYRVINGLFMGGMALLIYGAISYILKIGFFDIVIYSHKKLRQYTKRHEQDRKDGIEDESQMVGSFHEYILNKEEKPLRILPIIVGAGFTIASIVLVMLV